MTVLRPIEPIDITGLKPQAPSSGMPIIEYVDPRSLWVDPAYQRNLSERSMRMLRRIVEGFDWTKLKPPIVAFGDDEAGGATLRVLDGQHTAIAAASNPFVSKIPVMIVDAPDTRSQAEAFLGQNTDRLGMTAVQMHAAAVTAGKREAVALEQICAEAGVTIRRSQPSGNRFDENDTVAVAALATLYAKDGPIHTGTVLQILAKAGLAPIKADHIKAVDLLLTEGEYGSIDVDALPGLIRSQGGALQREAAAFGATHSVPLWRALAAVCFKKGKKRRAGA